MIQYLRQQMESNQQNEDAIRAQLDSEKNKAQRLGQILADLARNERENLRLSERIQEYQNQVDGIGINKDKMVITSIPRKPTLSTRPVNPRLAITGILSLMLGSIAGLGIIWVLDIMDDRFRTPEELKLQLDTQVLSMIPRMEELQGKGLQLSCAIRNRTRRKSKRFEPCERASNFRRRRRTVWSVRVPNRATARRPFRRIWQSLSRSPGNAH